MAAKRKRATRMGRPPVDPDKRTVRASVALSREDLAALRAAADARGVSVSSIVAGLVRRWLKRQGRRK